MFIYFWETETAQVREGQRKKETESPKQAPGSELSAQSPTRGSNSRTVRSRPESKSDAYPTDIYRRSQSITVAYTLFFLIFNLYLVLKDRTWAGEGQRERETHTHTHTHKHTESKAGFRLWAISTEPDAGLTNCKIVTWAKVGRSTDWATQAPLSLFLSNF